LDLSLDLPKVQEKATTPDTDRLKQEDEATKKIAVASMKEEATMKPVEDIKIPVIAQPLNPQSLPTGQAGSTGETFNSSEASTPHPYSEKDAMKSNLQDDIKIIQDIQKTQTPVDT
jgi:hypothetical protein